MVSHTKNIIEPFCIDFNIYFTDKTKQLAEKLIKLNPSPEVSNELRNDLINDDADASVSAGMMGLKRDRYGIIAIFDIESIKDEPYSYFIHEAGHVLSNILLFTGAKYDPNNDEWTSYMLDYISRMMIKAYEKL